MPLGTETDLSALRARGLDHVGQPVVAYINCINRIADALHVELEREMPPPGVP